MAVTVPRPPSSLLRVCAAGYSNVGLMSEGAAYKLLPGEETLTDINLIELKRNLSALVFTEKFSRYREGRETSADWEWWIADEHGWLGLRIQARPGATSCQMEAVGIHEHHGA